MMLARVPGAAQHASGAPLAWDRLRKPLKRNFSGNCKPPLRGHHLKSAPKDRAKVAKAR